MDAERPATLQRERRTGFKPREVEELVDYYYHRPLAGLLVKALLPLPVTADQITWASGVVGLLAGAVLALTIWYGPVWSIVAGFVLLFGVLLDCSDGQLARIRGTSSIVGRILDGTIDVATPTALFHGWAFYLLAQGYSFWFIWPLGWFCAYCLAWHSAQYDGIKNIYLHCARPDFSLGGTTLLTVEDIEGFKRDFTAKGQRFNVFLMNVWIRWTGSQRKAMAPWLGERVPRTNAERDLFRTVFRGDMRAWSWLGFGTHMIIFELVCWLTPVGGDGVVFVGWGIILVPMNVLILWLLRRRRALEARYDEGLRQLRREAAA